MNKIILDKNQVDCLVRENRYKVSEKTKFLSRCIDGRYPTSLKLRGVNQNLSPLAIPGADVGELAVIFAAGNNFGFEIDAEKAFQSLVKIIGGVKNFQLHSDHHADKNIIAGGCGHWKQINLDPEAYSIKKDQIDFIAKKLIEVKRAGAKEIILEGEHLEGAVVLVVGNYSIFSRCFIETNKQEAPAEVFVYHKTLVNERHRVLASTLLKNKAVKLYEKQDEDYLYHAFCEIADSHLFETAKRLAKGLPIYQINFDNNDNFSLKEIGLV